ncbi:MAG: hypothetical protein ACNA78_05250 [Balneolaceae bacterium]
MLLRWLFIALLLYALYRLLTRRKRHNGPFAAFRFQNDQNRRNGNPHKTKDFDRIEEAEFEDITDKEADKKS